MRKELFIHFLGLILLFSLISLFKGWFSFSLSEVLTFWPFWVGGVLGTILPDLDHIIYVYFLRPQELVSQRFNYMVAKNELWQSLNYLADTRSERSVLIFHTALFQVIFLILTVLVVTSSGSIFGRGLVLAFLLHLSIDQVIDFRETGGLENWTKDLPIVLDKSRIIYYMVITFLLVLLFGFLL